MANGEYLLVGCISSIEASTVSTRFFFLNRNTEESTDVTKELCTMIASFNEAQLPHRGYREIIPYSYKDELAHYSYGCGLSHYLSNDKLPYLGLVMNGNETFPVQDCEIAMLTPSDWKAFFGLNNVFHLEMESELVKHYFRTF